MSVRHYIFFTLFISPFSLPALAQTVDVGTFEKGLDGDVQLLDVRTPEEYQQGHLENAMLANWKDNEEFMRRIEALDKSEPVYIYCLSGGRSAAAKRALEAEGFAKIVELKGGITAWRQADKPEISLKKAAAISDASYAAMLQSASVVLVDFGASWCPPCRRMEPVMESLRAKVSPAVPIIKIDGSSQTALMKTHNVSVMPTYILYQDGKEVWRKSGMMKLEEFEKIFKEAGVKF